MGILDYREFTKTDWDCFAGATVFKGGQQPLIHTRNLNKGLVKMIIIADQTGLELYLTIGADVDQDVWRKEIPNFSSMRAMGELKHLIEYLNKFDYAPDVAYELDHPSDPVTQGFEFC